MYRVIATLAAGLLAVAMAPAGQACSIGRSYKAPTNLELAEQGEVIVIAEVSGQRAGEDAYENTVIARPTVLLKGEALPPSVDLPDSWLEEGTEMLATVSSPRELRSPNPDTLIGGCVRYLFAKGMQLVLFLHRDESGALTPFRSAFSRDAEDVENEDGLWVKAVREYAAISLLPQAQRQAQLQKRMLELQAQADDPDSLAIAEDMRIELEGAQPSLYD